MSDPTFPYRALVGVGALLAMGAFEWQRTRRTTRLREYVFLFGCAGAAIAYALVHDAFTFRLSYDYFALGKGLDRPDFWPDVAWLATQAGWTAGLALGLGLLVANNPSIQTDQLSYRQMVLFLRWPLFGAACAALLGFGLSASFPTPLGAWLDVHRFESARPHAFLSAWCTHIGSYLGAALGGLVAIFQIRRVRRKESARTRPL